ncbi:MAG TPA: autotransporter domain-containing protein [Parvibaculum sp.]|jgi:outer membrane autotransporter protein
MSDVSRSACGHCRRTVFVRPEFMGLRLRTLLRTAVAGIALSVGAQGAHAAGIDWGGGSGQWGTAANWNPQTAPTGADTANVSDGEATIGSSYSVDTLNLSGGQIEIDDAGALDAATVDMTAGLFSGAGSVTVGAGGAFTQSGGDVSELTILTPTYNHSGGNLGGVLTIDTYNLTDAAATSAGGTIGASVLFALSPASDTATVDAYLTGTGNLVKSGDSTVVLTNAANDFTGTVSVEEGTLEAVDDALPDDAVVSIDDGATLTMRTGNDTSFNGAMSGEGTLTKEDGANLTLGGEISLGTLAVNAGTLEIGTGASDNEASFGSATVADGAALHVATGATLTIGEGGSLTNNGNIGNDGTVNDALDNTGTVNNYGSWNGDVASNSIGGIGNDGADAVWTGDVVTNDSQISNQNGAAWNGDVLGNTNVIFNREDSTWTGDVAAMDGGQIENSGIWKGDVASNNGWIFQLDGSWEGDVVSNSNSILVMGGTWTGDVVTNEASVVNRAGVWIGDVLGNTGTVENDADGSWTGDVTNGTGTLQNYGSWTGDVKGNSGFFFNDGEDAVWTGDVIASDSQIVNQNGAAWKGDVLGNNNAIYNYADSTWTGDVIANGGGSNTHALIDNYGTWIGDVKGNAVTIYNDFAWNGDVTANAGKVINYTGVWTGDITGNTGGISNRSGVTWNGDVTGNDGTIENRLDGIWNGSVLANAGTINNKGVWTGAFTNGGTVNAENRINGAFDNSGTLIVTGSLAGITTLTNSGMIDMRGNGAAQTLSTANAIFEPNSIYAFDVDAAGNTDKIAVTGTAALDGTVRVAAATGTSYDASTVYTILTANNVLGEFRSVSTDLAFLAPQLRYETGAVELTLLRNDVGFGSVGTTPNQSGTGAGVESLGAGNALYDAVLGLNADQAAAAFDALSGEPHSSVEGGYVQDAGLVADVVTDRMDEALDASGDASGDASIKSNARVASIDAGFVPSFMSPLGTRLWGQIYGKRDSIAAGSNVAGTTATTGGFAAGFDGPVAGWRLGLLLQAGRSRNETAGLNSSADSTDYGIGIYGGRRWGRTGLSLGGNYTRHDISSDRHVAFAGIVDTLSADYSSGTAQVFGKLSQRYDLDAVSLSPYASLAYVRNDAESFTETGGPAALISGASHIDAISMSAGVSAGREFTLGNGVNLTARGKLGWRHTFADTPTSLHRFAGGTDFTVSGAPIDGDTLITGAGFDINEVSSLDISYEERVGGDAEGHALMGTWAMRF